VADTPSKLDDFMDVFLAPAALFDRRRDGRFGLALLVLVLLSAAIYFGTRPAMQPVFDAEYDRQIATMMERNPAMTAQQAEAGRGFAGVAAAGFVIVGIPVIVLILGAVVMGAGRVAGARLSFTQSATITTFAMFPRLVEGLVNALQALIMDETSLTGRFRVSLGPGRFLDPDTQQMLLALVGRLDLFTLWVTALIAIGIRVMGRTTAGAAVGAAALVWLVGAIPGLVGAL
jgi:hypothetical protein